MNKRGEAVTITVVALAIVAGLIGLFSRPVVDKVFPMFGGQQKTIQKEVVTVEPIYVKLPPTTEYPKGQIVVASQISTKLDDFKGEEKVTIWSWVKSLANIWFICLLLGVPGAAAIGLKLRAGALAAKNLVTELTTSKEELTSDAKKIVRSVDNGLASMDANIKASNSLAESTIDPVVKNQYTAISKALIDMKQDFLAELSKTQDSTTKLLVSELKND